MRRRQGGCIEEGRERKNVIMPRGDMPTHTYQDNLRNTGGVDNMMDLAVTSLEVAVRGWRTVTDMASTNT